MINKERLKLIMPMTGNSTSPNKVLAAENIINKNIFNLNNYYDIYVDINNQWSTKSNSRSLRRWLHTHIFLSDFTRAYAETNDEKYFIKSFELLNHWFENFPLNKRDEIDELAYHDEGTAIRLLFWFKYYNEFYKLFNDEQLSLFESKIDETASLLNQEDFYAGLNNHGMFQDMGLIAYSLFKFEEFSKNNIFNKALDRIEQYFREVFTVEGIHKEHAPSYHVLLLHSLKQILQSLDKADFSDSRTEFLKEIFKKGENYTINITMPDFKLPNVSDSTQINMSTSGIYKNLFESEEYKFITSGGKEGISPKQLINSYPKSGYLIARNGWDRNSTYFLFLASYHMHYHKHTDDLSFILYNNGPIFIDSGPHSYDYKDPYTNYAYSQFAHSTLIVNNSSLPRTDYKFNDVYITHQEINHEEQSFVVEGINNRYIDTSHRRSITGNLKTGKFEIIDKILSQKFNQYKVIFQINGDLNVLQNGNITSIFKNNAKVAELEVGEYNGLNGVRVYTVSGQKYPQVMGYQFPKVEQAKASKTLIIEGYNNTADSEIKTYIRLTNFKVKGNNNFNRKNELKQFRDISYIYEDNSHEKLAVVFSPTESEYNYKLDDFSVLKGKGFNILYIFDNQATVGRSFIQGESSSTVESDVLIVISRIMRENNFTDDDVYFIGRSKAGFAALYYAMISGFNNVFISSPLTLIGDYYSRHEKFKPLVKTLGFENVESIKYYLNDYLNNINDFSKLENVNICIGENDYHKEKHVDYLIKWLDEKNIGYDLHIYPNAIFSEDKIKFVEFLKNYNFEK